VPVPFRLSPAFPIAIALALAPTLAVLQFRGIAALTAICFAAAVLLARRAEGRWPWPRAGAALAAALALGALLLVSALWAADPGRAAFTGLRFAGFVALGAAAAFAMRGVEAPHLAHLRTALLAGLALGIALAAADHLSGNLLRATVRGLREAPPHLYFGLKPAVSVIAVLLPLAVGMPGLRPALRGALAVAGLGTALLLPAESAKIAAALGLVLLLVAPLAGAWLGRLIGAGLAIGILAAPLILGAVLPRLPALEGIPPSAAHRVLIWDFVGQRMAERPLLGWGGEGSRTIPGGQAPFDAAELARYGLSLTSWQSFFDRPAAQRLPLHTHNAPLQIWLELGLAGALAAAALALAMGALAARAGGAATACLGATLMVGMLSYGVWQEWWIGLQLLLVVAVAALSPASRAR
jgi:O-antigen ligase